MRGKFASILSPARRARTQAGFALAEALAAGAVAALAAAFFIDVAHQSLSGIARARTLVLMQGVASERLGEARRRWPATAASGVDFATGYRWSLDCSSDQTGEAGRALQVIRCVVKVWTKGAARLDVEDAWVEPADPAFRP